MEISLSAETAIAVGSALIGSVAGAILALRIEKRKDKLAEEKSRIQMCYQNCLRLDDLLADWYTAIYDAVTFKDTAEETIDALRRFDDQPNFERRLKRIVDDMADEPSCAGLRGLAWAFRDKCLGTKEELKMTLESRFPRGYGKEKSAAMAILKAKVGDFNNELGKVIDRLRTRLNEIKL